MNKTKIRHDFIKKIESELLSTLIGYVLPFINKKIKPKQKEQKTSGLENIVNSTPKIRLEDVKELESILLRNLDDKTKTAKNLEIKSGNLFYSINLRRQKNEKSNDKYSVSIKYEENGTSEKLEFSVKKPNGETYSSIIETKKDKRDNVAPYILTIHYENDYSEERLAISYKQQLRNYLKQHIESKEDMSNMVPLKWLNILPESVMGGVLGFTYLGDSSMGRRADLTGNLARMVDIHESIHTPDEYETRILTEWILAKPKVKYIK